LYKSFFPYIIFFISGFCGLGYEILWCREFNLILGHTTYATAIVLASFMTGLAIGSYYLGFAADRVKSAVKLYAYAELAIGFYGIFFYRLIEIYKSFYILAYPYIPSPAVEAAFKLFSAFALMIIPTTLMGGTFPIMAKIIIESVKTSGRSVGLIYFFNSAGGAIGCFTCGFYMLYNFGSEFSLNIFSALNILCGTLMLFYKNEYGRASDETCHENGAAMEPCEKTKPVYNYIFIFSALSGFVSMLLEICWTRFLILVIGSSTYSFSLMLSVFIFFLSIGSLLASYFVDKIKNPLLAFGVCEFLIGAYILLTLPFYEKLPLFFVYMNNSLSSSYYIYMALSLIICLIVMAVPALLFGASFPFSVRAVEIRADKGASAVGKLYSYNTVGCILGSFLTGILILPCAGFKNSIELAIVIALLTFIASDFFSRNVYGVSPADLTAKKRLAVMRVICVFMIASIWFLPAWDYKILNIGSFYRNDNLKNISINNLKSYNEVLLYYKESISATVCVTKDTLSGLKFLKINGKSDGSTIYCDKLSQDIIAVLPMARAKCAKNVLIIGMGTGATLAAACKFSEAEKITCVEIIPEVIQAAKCFNESYDVYKNDARVSIVINDARSFLLTAKEKFDVIISEPSNPWISGISSLFTTDFFNLCRDKLNDEGVMLAWIQAYESSPAVFKLALRTYVDVFDGASLWFNKTYDIFAIAVKTSPGALKTSFSGGEPYLCYQKIKSLAPVRKILENYSINDPLTFSTLYFMTPGQLKAYVGDGILNSDNFQLIEYEAPILLYTGERVALDYMAYADTLGGSIRDCASFAPEIPVNTMIANAAFFLGSEFIEPKLPLSLLDMLIYKGAAGEKVYHLKASLLMKANEHEAALNSISRALEIKPDNLQYLKLRALLSLKLSYNKVMQGAEENLKNAEAGYLKISAVNPSDMEAWNGLLSVYRLKHDEKALKETAVKAYEAYKTKDSQPNPAGIYIIMKAAEKLIEINKYESAIELYNFAFTNSQTDSEKEFAKNGIENCRYLIK